MVEEREKKNQPDVLISFDGAVDQIRSQTDKIQKYVQYNTALVACLLFLSILPCLSLCLQLAISALEPKTTHFHFCCSFLFVGLNFHTMKFVSLRDEIM